MNITVTIEFCNNAKPNLTFTESDSATLDNINLSHNRIRNSILESANRVLNASDDSSAAKAMASMHRALAGSASAEPRYEAYHNTIIELRSRLTEFAAHTYYGETTEGFPEHFDALYEASRYASAQREIFNGQALNNIDALKPLIESIHSCKTAEEIHAVISEVEEHLVTYPAQSRAAYGYLRLVLDEAIRLAYFEHLATVGSDSWYTNYLVSLYMALECRTSPFALDFLLYRDGAFRVAD